MLNEWSINEDGEVFLVDELNGYSYEKIKQRYLPAQGLIYSIVVSSYFEV